MFCLHLFAHKIPWQKFYYISLYTGPPIILLDGLVHLGTTRMHSIGWTICFFHDRSSQIINIRYIYSALHVQNSILSNSEIFSNITIHNLMYFFDQLVILHLLFSDLINQCWSYHKTCYQRTISIIIQVDSYSFHIQQQWNICNANMRQGNKRLPAQCIRYHISFPGMVINDQIIVLNQFQPSSLSHINKHYL